MLTFTGCKEGSDIMGGWAGRPVSAGAALAVSVTVQAIGVHADHENGLRVSARRLGHHG